MRFVSYKCCNNICFVLVFLLLFDFVLVFLKSFIVLNFDSISSLFQKVDHLLAIEYEVNSSDIYALNSQFLLKVFFEKNTSRGTIGLAQFLGEHLLELLPVTGADIDFDVVVRGREVKLVVSFAEAFGIELIYYEES